MEPPSPASAGSRSSSDSPRNAWANTQPRIRPLSGQFAPSSPQSQERKSEDEKLKGHEGSPKTTAEVLEEIIEEEENTPRNHAGSSHHSETGETSSVVSEEEDGELEQELEDGVKYAASTASFSTPHLTLDSSVPFENISLEATSPSKHRPRALNLHFSNGSTGTFAFRNSKEKERERKMDGFGPKRPSSVMGIVRPSTGKKDAPKRETIKEEDGRESSRNFIQASTSTAAEHNSPNKAEPVRTSNVSRPSTSEPSSSSAFKVKKRSSHGPTPLQKVLSKTRPRNLPPKDPHEDKLHLKMHEDMMKAAKELEKAKEGQLKFKRYSRELRLESAKGSWEKDILPNWKIVLRNEPHSNYLRELWWNGTMPPRHRGRLWSLCIGNALAIGKTSYTRSLSHALNLIETSMFPTNVLEAIEEDISNCFVGLKIFQRDTGPMYTDLREVLLAWSVFWKERPNYVKGAAYPAALLLLNLTAPEAFLSLVNLISKSCLKCIYSNDEETIEAYYRIFDTILADNIPKLYQHFLVHSVRPSMYLRPWLRTAFAAFLTFDTTVRLFDIFVLEGDSFLFRVALAVLEILSSRLQVLTELEELQELFDGREHGVVSVLKRERHECVEVERQDVYEAMGASEESIWASVRGIEWRKETWERLVERELPE